MEELNILEANFTPGVCNAKVYTRPVWQWSYGQILKINGLDLPFSYEVHFSNEEMTGQTITMIGDEDGVAIPDQFISSNDEVIYAWLFLHEGEDDGETVSEIIIQKKLRPEPSNEAPTPEEQSVIEQAISALNAAVETTGQDVIDANAAKDAAETAQTAAETAQTAAETAQTAAETAQGKAEDAQAEAERAAENVHIYAEEAKEYAEDAERSAQAVLGLTADATVDSNVGTPSVSVSVTTESDHKNMSFAFHNLKGVQGDPGDTGVGISSVVLNANYTLTITLTNGTSYTTSSIRGEVGATPNLTIGTVTTLPEGSQATATITGTDEDPVLNLGIPVGDTGDPGISPTITVTEITGGHEVAVTDAQGTQTFDVMDGEVSEQDLEDALIDKADVITSSASGEIVTISDGGNDLPVVDLKVSLLPVQSGSGDPSPDNVRPISGWTGVDVTQTAENLLGGVTLAETFRGCVSFALDTTNHTFNYGRSKTPVMSGVKWKENTRYTFIWTFTAESRNNSLYIRYTDGTSEQFLICESTTTKNTIVARTASGKTVKGFYLSYSQWGKVTVYYDESGVFEGVLTASDFKPYVGQIYPINWTSSAGTVYGGSLDVTSGVLTVDRCLVTLDGTETWKTNGSSDIRRYFYANFDIPMTLRNLPISSHYVGYGVSTSNTGYGINVALVSGDMSITCRPHNIVPANSDNISTWTAYLASQYANGTPVQVCYEIETPIEYQLTPTQISTLLGTNNFWSNGNGVVDLEYRCDTKLYIENLTKPSEDDMTANANIASGKFFMIGNRLFLSTTAIAQGEQIVVGTNCSEVSLADALNQINA